jgi:hypothetical protein
MKIKIKDILIVFSYLFLFFLLSLTWIYVKISIILFIGWFLWMAKEFVCYAMRLYEKPTRFKH